MRIIACVDDIAAALDGLAAADPRLVPVMKIAGPVPLRRRAPGFEGLAEIVVSQQVSKASAEAIWGRLMTEVAPFAPETFIGVDDEALKRAGLSRPKQRTLRAVAAALCDGFDLDTTAQMEGTEAIAAMTALHGIGPWTAEVYLMFCCGHPDLFPARDVALQNAVQHAFGLEERPGEKALYALSEQWAPWRATAARLFWAYYAAIRGGRESVPV
ncbi:MAG: DNA-3-methyladenine glycosylase 2 family protein [Rhodobiaceae bacterium]|nr:DNA-3-methyladenine glycosylase 2 family protein [Rhodobiaceae bacterium]